MLRQTRWALLLAAVISPAVLADSAPARGMLLVANPELKDPHFAESVVLLLHYGSEGALGLIINRPTWVEPSSILPAGEKLEGYDGRVFVGGPVAPGSLVTLLRQTPAEATPETVPILDDIYVSTDPNWLAGVAARARNDTRLRLYAGHALWAPGQLEQEIEAGGWRVVQGHAGLVFSATPLTLWTSLLEAPPEVQAGIATPPAATGERPGMTPRYAVRLLR